MLILDCSDGVRPLSTASFGCRSAPYSAVQVLVGRLHFHTDRHRFASELNPRLAREPAPSESSERHSKAGMGLGHFSEAFSAVLKSIYQRYGYGIISGLNCPRRNQDPARVDFVDRY
jgi:hypothetical protein